MVSAWNSAEYICIVRTGFEEMLYIIRSSVFVFFLINLSVSRRTNILIGLPQFGSCSGIFKVSQRYLCHYIVHLNSAASIFVIEKNSTTTITTGIHILWLDHC